MCRVPATAHRAKIVDVSYHGCRVELAHADKPPGATIHIELGPSSRITGQIMWSGVGDAGVRFARALRSSEAVQLGLEQPQVQEVTIEPPREERDPLPLTLRHWFRRLCGLTT